MNLVVTLLALLAIVFVGPAFVWAWFKWVNFLIERS